MDKDFLKSINILVVEDSKVEREIFVETIKKSFPNVFEAINGKIAYDLIQSKQNIDIVITDINMPEMTGFELLKLVRKTDKELPFIFLTGGTNLEEIISVIDLNISSFLLKPVDNSLLMEKINFLCEKKKIHDKLEKKNKEVENYLEAVDRVSLIFKMNGDGKISYMNKPMHDISKYEIQEVKDLTFDDIIHPDIPKKYISHAWEVIKSGKLWKGNTKFITKDNETFYLNNTIFKTSNEKDEYITIAFLTTKENLKKRDFQKKVLSKIQESNKREHELVNKNNELEKENKELEEKLEKYIKAYKSNTDLIDSLNKKNTQKEQQITFYEKKETEIVEKYEQLILKKKEEIESLLKQVHFYKNEHEANNK